MKQGQVTLFAVFGVILVLIVGFLLYLSSDLKQEDPNIREKTVLFDYNEGTVDSFVSSCMNPLLSDAVILLASNGGYLDSDMSGVRTIVSGGNPVPVWLDEPYLGNVSEDAMAKMICRRVYISLGSCLDFSIFSGSGMDVYSKDITSDPAKIDSQCTAIIRDDSVVVSINYPIVLSKEGSSMVVSDFTGSTPLALGKMKREADLIISNLKDADPAQPYNFDDYCTEYSMFDNNIYLSKADTGSGIVVHVVDYKPEVLNLTQSALRLQFGVDGILLEGKC